ncbi:TonB-dependent receptor family protein [Halomonas cupida]|uniref:TonB-dependent receptor family protein n=1 Tax=Halomonas cupida TaxID=44933 RepID=UPI003A912846
MIRPALLFSAPALLLVIHPALGQSTETASVSSPLELEPITVEATRLARELYTTPVAVSVVDQSRIAPGQQRIRIDESLSTVPGVFINNRDNQAQGARVSIRGFGSRAQFGVRGITLVVDGIPYTLPDGQAQLDAIDLDSAERIEVIRGPAAVQYGNAAGGVISVTTADGRGEGPSTTHLHAGVGSDGYRKLAVQNGGENGDWSHHISASSWQIDGYRDHSEARKTQLNAHLRRQLDDDRALSATLNLLDNPKAEDPGGLTLEQVKEDRRQAGAFTEEYDTGQSVDQQVFGLQYEDLGFGPGELYLRGFVSWRDFEQQLPYPGDSLIDYQRNYYGGSAEYRQQLSVAGRPLDVLLGVDAARQKDDRHRQEIAFSGENLGEVADETQIGESVGVFAQGDLALTDAWNLSLGARYDHISLEVEDDYLNDGDQSGKRNFDEFNGSLGVSYRYHPRHQLYANTGTAFETPTFSEFANPNGSGGFNPDIEPQKAWSRELGARGTLDWGLDYDIALFSVDVEDELVPYEGDSGRTFYTNAGDTSRDGVELALGWQALDSLRLDTALTLARYRFDTVSGDKDLDDNRLPGLPETTWVNELTWFGDGEGLERPFASLETQYIGDMVADNANQVDVDSYWLVNLRAGNGWKMGTDSVLAGYVGIRNLFDEEYYSNVRINANNARYFEPAPDRAFYAGVELEF